MTSGLETEWDYSGRKGRDGQKKKMGIKANERKGKVKRGKDEEVNGQGGRGVPRPHTGQSCSGRMRYMYFENTVLLLAVNQFYVNQTFRKSQDDTKFCPS